MDVRRDDLSSDATRSLLALHLAGMHANTPPGCGFALDLSGLQVPEVTVWSAWEGSTVIGIAALKRLADESGEVKSMRTHPDHLRKGGKRGKTAGHQAGAVRFRTRSGSDAMRFPSGMASLSPR